MNFEIELLKELEAERQAKQEQRNKNKERKIAASIEVDELATAKQQKDKNERAQVGTIINCPVCNKSFRKMTYNHVFCSNGRNTKGRSSCKDTYWNCLATEKSFTENEQRAGKLQGKLQVKTVSIKNALIFADDADTDSYSED